MTRPAAVPSEDMPAWPMRFEASERTYSPRLVIQAPDTVTVELLSKSDDD